MKGVPGGQFCPHEQCHSTTLSGPKVRKPQPCAPSVRRGPSADGVPGPIATSMRGVAGQERDRLEGDVAALVLGLVLGVDERLERGVLGDLLGGGGADAGGAAVVLELDGGQHLVGVDRLVEGGEQERVAPGRAALRPHLGQLDRRAWRR